MAWPASLTLVTVTIQADLPPTGGATGWIDFTAPYPLQGTSVVPPFTKRAYLDQAGAGSIQLPACNDPQWAPSGWAYTVTGSIGTAAISGTLQLDYQSASADFAALLQVDGTAETGVSYLLVSQRGVANGVASLDADGLVPVSQLPPGAGGDITASQITDSTVIGRTVLTAANAAAILTAIGALSTSGGTITGNLTVADLLAATKAYRLKTSGGSLDLDAGGADLYVSNWTGAAFDGTQRTYLRLESGAQLAHAVGRWLFADSPFAGSGVADLDASTGVAAVGAKNGLDNIRFCGLKATTGAPSTGTWTTGDAVLDANGQLWICTAGGTSGTWTSAISAHTAAADPHTQYASIYYWNGSSYDLVTGANVYVGGTGPVSPTNGDVVFES